MDVGYQFIPGSGVSVIPKVGLQFILFPEVGSQFIPGRGVLVYSLFVK
jgi:hypothetical protein